jgi:hypothetical protein
VLFQNEIKIKDAEEKEKDLIIEFLEDYIN